MLYAIRFENGVVKVGTTKNIDARVASHRRANRIQELVYNDCENITEKDLIRLCAATGEPIAGCTEYFTQVEYEHVKKCVQEDHIFDTDRTIIDKPFLGGKVRQNLKTGMYCITDVEGIGNAYRRENKLMDKQMTQYFKNKDSQEFIRQVAIDTRCSEDELVKVIRGINGGTWVHPYIFTDMVMWFDQRFKVKIIKWFQDILSEKKHRPAHDVVTALESTYPGQDTSEVTHLIDRACGVTDWNKATEEQLKLRDKIHENIILLSEVAPELGTCVNKAINLALAKFSDLI